MHEIILILLMIGISGIPNGYFIKHDIKDIEIKKPVFNSKKKSNVSTQVSELDMDMFNGLSKDVQDIILKYLED